MPDEQPLHMDVIQDLIEDCDLLIVIGSSNVVDPAAGFSEIVQLNGGQTACFNTSPVPGASFTFTGPCEETLPLALA